ncbi:MAG: class D sortase [Proteobacteria bacterium]|nr:class D sortase [Pseudomonadota bacterium]
MRWLEVTLWTAGLVLLSYYAALRVSAEQDRRAGVEMFQAARHIAHAQAPADRLLVQSGHVDKSLWSEARVRAFRRTTLHEVPEGVLRIPALGLVVPIYSGTTSAELDRGAGHVEGTAPIDSAGNAAIAGHRDGFFRSLRRIKIGQMIYVETLSDTRRYRVIETQIVAPSDVSVLAPTVLPSITLITCYPFYFVGPAPGRFIVRAEFFPSRQHAADGRIAEYSQRQE